MPGYWSEGRRGRVSVQAKAGVVCVALALGGCGGDPLSGPVDLFHDLQGGEIAAQRPPPPGAGQPYPKLGSVPGRPVLPAASYRNGLAAQLLAERDRTERVAADTPVEAVPPLPTALPVAAAAGAAPGAGAPVAAASLETAEASPPVGRKPVDAVQAGPAAGAPLVVAGAPADFAAAPSLPDAPPPPALFEGVSVEPAPTQRVLPAGTALPTGTQVYFCRWVRGAWGEPESGFEGFSGTSAAPGDRGCGVGWGGLRYAGWAGGGG